MKTSLRENIEQLIKDYEGLSKKYQSRIDKAVEVTDYETAHKFKGKRDEIDKVVKDLKEAL